MAFQPAPIRASLPPFAVALVESGRAGRLVIYAGAGLSRAEPAGLPTGADVAQRVYDRLHDVFPAIDGCDSQDLLSVSDAIAGLPNGEEALRFTAVKVAEFTTATPTYGHRILALLVLEGLVDVLTTNWDDCVERAGGPERVFSIVTEHDLLNVTPKSILKIHGCATQPNSLLITTQHLETPPTWVCDQVRARLGASVVVFVGIGDVAGYVCSRIEEAIADVGEVNNIRVVGPRIVAEWDESKWAELVPTLDADHRLAVTADEFLDNLAAAYVHVTLADVSTEIRDEPELVGPFHAASEALGEHDAWTVLAWSRQSAVVATAGKSVFGAPATASALMALGKLAGNQFRIGIDRIVATPHGALEVLVAVGFQTASRLRREARNRLERHLGNGLDEMTFLVAGGIGWKPDVDPPDVSILGEGDERDVLDGPLNVTPRLMRAEVVVAG